MTTNRCTRVLLTAALAVGTLAACERSVTNPVATTPAKVPAVRAYATPLTDAPAMGKFQVCSVGAAATYSFSAALGSGSSGGPTSGSMTIAAGDCEIIYDASYVPSLSTHNLVTVRMTGITTPNMQLSSLIGDSLFWHCNTGPCVTDDVQTNLGTDSTLTYNVNGDVGALATFTYTAIPQPPSISITKTADAASVPAGDSIGFTITVNSNGPGTAQNVTLSDALPTGTGISWSVNPAVSGCTITTNTLVCNFGSMASGASQAVHVRSGTGNGSCATYNNTATASATGLTNVQASASTTVTCPPSISITKTADAASVTAGNPIGFTITVKSNGPGSAQNVTLSDALPTGTGISWSISPAVAGCSIVGGTLTCSFGTMPADSFKTVHVTSPTMNGSCGTYNNTATASATGLTNVTASASTAVTGCTQVCTATQGGWGQGASGRNIGWMRDTFWSTVYPSGSVTVGTGFHMTFTSAAAVEAYLPAGKTPGVLGQNYTNPLTTPAGVFGGQVTALRLNVDFSNAGVNGWKPNLASATVASGPLAGRTVAQVLAIAQSVLGGGALPAGMSVSNLNDLVSDINGMNSPDGCGFGDGTVILH